MDAQAAGDAAPRAGDGAAAQSDVHCPTGSDCLTGADDSFGLGSRQPHGTADELPPGVNLGGVTIVRLLAEGGMGRVYEARQEAPRRTVAVKVIRAGAVSPAAAARLVREAETLALLHHPHIAQVHTCGTAPEAHGGVPFFVMEMVDGAQTITHFSAGRSLSIRARVALFRRACEAVAHAHRHGVVHRDLKPANILVDGSGEPKLIDFGIARGVEADARMDAGRQPEVTGADGITQTGDVVGTLRYMSPEQVLEPHSSPDSRSDVYALGLVLHELVTGRLPYDLAGMPLAEAVRLLAGAAAPATGPVERAASATERRDDARALAVIVATCLEPRPADRYTTAGEVADDVGRWLDGRAIVARPPTALESIRRLARRHRVATAAVTSLAAALVAAVVAVSLLSVRLDGQRREAERARAAAAAEAEAAERQLYASTVLLAAAARDRDGLADARRSLAEAESLAARRGGPRPIELDCLAASLDDAIAVLPQADASVTAVAWSPDGRVVATGDRAGVVRVRDAEAPPETPSRTLVTREQAIWSLAFSPDGRWLAIVGRDGMVALHDARSGSLERTIGTAGTPVYAVAFTADSGRVVTGSRDRSARIWSVTTGRELRVLEGHEGTVYGAAFAPDGRSLATASHDATVRIWETRTGKLRHTLRGHGDRVFDVAFAPDGAAVASASEDGTVRLWDPETGTETGRLEHPARVNALAFAADGTRVATAAADGVVRVWDVDRSVELEHLRGHGGAVWSIDWAPLSDRIASGGADGVLRLWDAAGRPSVATTAARVLAAAYAPDGAILATGGADAEIRLWDAATLRERGRLGPAQGRVHGVAWSPDGALVAAACDDGGLFVWEAATREQLVAVRAHTRRVYAVAFAPDGDRLATAGEDRTVSLRHARTGALAGPALAHPRRVFCAAFAADGAQIATACEDRLVRLWNADTGVESARLEGHSGPVNWVAFAPDGRRLASAASDGTVRVWNLADGSVAHVLSGPTGQVWKVGFTPDGTRIGAAGADGAVHLWDAAAGRAILALRGHRDQVWAIAFQPDGRALASGSWDGTVRMWGVADAEIARRRLASAR